MELFKRRLVGTTPIIPHSDRGANPLDPDVRAHKELTSKRKKTDDDHEAIMQSEWRLALYYDKQLGPYVPAMNVRASLIGGAKFNKLGTAVKRSTTPTQERLPLEYDGPRDQDAMLEAGRFTDVRSVKVGQARVMRCRPIFPEWSLEFELLYDPEQVEEGQLVYAFQQAGTLVGLGDYRPEKGGLFGRYRIE